ncbi:DUF2960 family protein [Grimontia hollisae]|uniref:Protein of uncharacterized function (DUF2960) n=1 Tax=Grimontia hollisae TaxID=673 RepID=A0A377J8K3_GRIHO|nr:DUF2960 family protein [Grimontia hollisae]MDF2184018.1 DUF2960 family protein [Grimontia hollisae]STO98565.1 Protein of uncharacterised function (DUF2960) [Grimontia hollisae]
MSRQLQYIYKGETKVVTFSYQKHRSPHEAAAEAEGIDLTDFLNMERQLESVADGKAVKNHRDSYFNKLGFGKITLLKKETASIRNKR